MHPWQAPEMGRTPRGSRSQDWLIGAQAVSMRSKVGCPADRAAERSAIRVSPKLG
jgi:hypothetical protein